MYFADEVVTSTKVAVDFVLVLQDRLAEHQVRLVSELAYACDDIVSTKLCACCL